MDIYYGHQPTWPMKWYCLAFLPASWFRWSNSFCNERKFPISFGISPEPIRKNNSLTALGTWDKLMHTHQSNQSHLIQVWQSAHRPQWHRSMHQAVQIQWRFPALTFESVYQAQFTKTLLRSSCEALVEERHRNCTGTSRQPMVLNLLGPPRQSRVSSRLLRQAVAMQLPRERQEEIESRIASLVAQTIVDRHKCRCMQCV